MRDTEIFNKEMAAKEVGCKYYIHLGSEDLLIVKLAGSNEWRNYIGAEQEFVVTEENHLICVTANSCESIKAEVQRKESAIGYVGVIEHMWYADTFEKII